MDDSNCKKCKKELADLKLQVGQLEILFLNVKMALKASQLAHKATRRSNAALRGVITKLKKRVLNNVD